ncbi:MAG: GIY-YIG nuclease family protein [Cyclobacteriaceae bacterium]
MEKGGNIYILTNKNKTVLYVGVTSDLPTRIHQHKTKVFKSSFTTRYNVDRLVYYEVFHSIEEAIAREKQLKGGSRKKKEELIDKFNPEWKDLYSEIMRW